MMRCALCGSTLKLTQGVNEYGTKWYRQVCQCGRTDMLHLDMGKLEYGHVRQSEGELDLDDEVWFYDE